MSLQQRRLILNAGLLLLVLGMAGVVWWKQQQPLPVPVTLLTLPKSAVKQITIERVLTDQSMEQIHLARQTNGTWAMQSPKQGVVNATRLTQLLTILDEPVAASYDATTQDLKRYGLQPSLASLIFNGQRLAFGDANPVSHNRYILNQNKIQLVSEAVYGLLTGDAADLLALSIVPASQQLTQIDFPEGYKKQLDTLENWRKADAMRVESWQVTDKATWPRITLHFASGQQLVLQLLSNEGDVVLGDVVHGIRYVLPETQRQGLLPH